MICLTLLPFFIVRFYDFFFFAVSKPIFNSLLSFLFSFDFYFCFLNFLDSQLFITEKEKSHCWHFRLFCFPLLFHLRLKDFAFFVCWLIYLLVLTRFRFIWFFNLHPWKPLYWDFQYKSIEHALNLTNKNKNMNEKKNWKLLRH